MCIAQSMLVPAVCRIYTCVSTFDLYGCWATIPVSGCKTENTLQELMEDHKLASVIPTCGI